MKFEPAIKINGMISDEQRDKDTIETLFDAIYYNTMYVGGDGYATIYCRNLYNNKDYIYWANLFEEYLTQKHNFVKVPKIRDENHKYIAHEGIEKGKHPFTRRNSTFDYEGTEITSESFWLGSETGVCFCKGTDKLKSDDWSELVITL